MNHLKFYNVDANYVERLRQVDSKIPNIAYDTNRKFLVGVLFSINGMNYYAPLSSFNQPQATNYAIRNSQNQVIATIRFSFMFPIPDEMIKLKEIDKVVDIRYRRHC